jgi:uncharacterized damage-inducible protein DinB
MIQGIAWFDRQFSFDLPAWMFPNIVERLRGTPARVEDRVRLLSHEILTRRDDDKWSIQEHVGHLWDLEALWLGRLDDFAAGTKTQRPADLQNRKTHEANHNAKAIDEILTSFRSARSAFVQRLDTADEAFVQRTSLHPRLQTPMRVIDMAFFVAEHDDHHLAHITTLIQKFAQ